MALPLAGITITAVPPSGTAVMVELVIAAAVAGSGVQLIVYWPPERLYWMSVGALGAVPVSQAW